MLNSFHYLYKKLSDQQWHKHRCTPKVESESFCLCYVHNEFMCIVVGRFYFFALCLLREYEGICASMFHVSVWVNPHPLYCLRKYFKLQARFTYIHILLLTTCRVTIAMRSITFAYIVNMQRNTIWITVFFHLHWNNLSSCESQQNSQVIFAGTTHRRRKKRKKTWKTETQRPLFYENLWRTIQFEIVMCDHLFFFLFHLCSFTVLCI